MPKFEIEMKKIIYINRSIIVEAESEYKALDMAIKQIDFSSEGKEYHDYQINYIKKIKNKTK